MTNQKLLAALREKGWPIEVAAARVGVGRVTLSRWVNGHQEPQPALLEKLCEVFGKPADDLGYGHLSKVPAQPEREAQDGQDLDTGPASLHLFTEEQFTTFAMLLNMGEAMMFDPEKRKTLQTLLTALTMAAVRPQGLLQPESWQHLLSSGTALAKTNEATIQGYVKLIEACWQLSRGNELALAEKLLPECMAKLVPLAQQPSRARFVSVERQ